jgi:DNA-binding transcriptional LysR family regulator
VVRVGALASSSLVARPLGHFRLINCASPAYLERHGVPRSLDDLADHFLVHYASVLGARPDGFEYVDGKRTVQRAMAGVLTVNNAEAYQAACLAGLGLIQAPESGLRPLLDAGQLREVLPAYQAAPMPVSLLYAHRRHVPKRAQVFMDWIADCVRPWTVENA